MSPARSLAFRSDLMILAMLGSSVEDRHDVTVVRSPARPDFYWGNFLLFAQPPSGEEAASWLGRFETEFPGARYVAIGIDGTDGLTGDVAPLLEAGCSIDVPVVLTATAVQPPPRPNRQAECRPLISDEDWEQALDLSLATSDSSDTAAGRSFAQSRLDDFRTLQERGAGACWGAFQGSVLASSLGVFTDGSGMARYQSVQTHPGHRGQGLAGTLVHRAGRFALEDLGARTLVIVVDPDTVALRVYRSVGFADRERQVQVQRASADSTG